MSRFIDMINQSYPAFAQDMRTVTDDERTEIYVSSELASYIVDQLQEGHHEVVRSAFDAADSSLADPDSRESVMNFIETVQNVSSHRAFGMKAFEPFLKPQSKTVWNNTCELWRGRSSLAEIVAAQKGDTSFTAKRKPREMLAVVSNPKLRRIIEQTTRDHS